MATPPLPVYAGPVLERAAEELAQLGPACQRHRVSEGCSAVALLVGDYGHMRDRIRAVSN